LHLRTASRLLVRLTEFGARDFAALENHARRIPWDRFTRAGQAVRFRVTCKKSRLYHQRAVAERFAQAAREAGRDVEVAPSRPDGAESGRSDSGLLPVDDAPAPTERPSKGSDAGSVQTLVVRLFRDRCTVSVDASGEHLHRRGYRQVTAKAPLRENLAAAVLLAVGWDPTVPLIDPMCGSGTLLIEAAMMARHMPPGLHRSFAFESWPEIDPAAMSTYRAEAGAGILSEAPSSIVGGDRDAGAVQGARANARRAGVEADVAMFHRPLSATAPPMETHGGWLVTNPPYGKRVGARHGLRDLYAALGNVARRELPGWKLAVVCPDSGLVGQIGISMEPCLNLRHGGLPVRVWTGQVPGG
jgi:putative N6-adenine-specific DNA methylase